MAETETTTAAPVFTVTGTRPGHAHTKIEGTYTGHATAADVERKFFGAYGGREIVVGGGRFSCIRHDD